MRTKNSVLEAIGRRIEEMEVGMVMEELAAVGAMAGNVEQGFIKLRDWTDQEADDAWVRVDVRLKSYWDELDPIIKESLAQ